ncbi:hypothetical protein BDF20DRAFT_436017 [Mycotypha africana]|uniref:uncharacterized protein n=1 Tax=Mycotypha africana TaxID=64632 RepID=UPI00230196F0|nr:uncharacterized protein BDF20DRAFT_436017 [Mycotypha africana]KAI8981902.1 hypothetical protein BDF20DRAFT_436017 [Mycotypha africana]
MWIRKNEKVPGSILSKVTSKESSILTRTTSTAPSLPPSDEFDVASNTSTIVLNSGSSNIVTSTTDDRHKDRKKVNTLSAFLSNSPYASSKMATSEISSHQSTRKSESSVSAHRFTIRVSKAKPSQQRGSNRSSNNFEDSSNCRSNAHKSMPVIESSFSLEKTKSTKQHHKHSMIRVSFPQGKVINIVANELTSSSLIHEFYPSEGEEVCNICREKMYDALMCNDGCGLMRHSECSNRAVSLE